MKLNVPTHQDLLINCDIIATEAFSVRPQMVSQAKDRLLASLVDTVRTSLRWDYSRPEVINISQARNAAQRFPYLEKGDLSFPMPVGFNPAAGGDNPMLSYATELKAAFIAHRQMYEAILPEVLTLLSGYVSDRPRLQEPVDPARLQRFADYVTQTDIPPAVAGGEKRVASPITRPIVEMYKYFDDRRLAYTAFSKLYGNTRSIVDTMEQVQALNKLRYEHMNSRTIARTVSQVEDLGKRLLQGMERDKPTPANTQLIMGAIKAMADWTFAYASLTTMALDLTNAMKLTEKQLLE